jgi:2'-5' RNA ligase
MRLFTAIEIPEELRRSVGRQIDRLRPAADLRWSRPENMHITTKFIGEWPEVRLSELEAVLKQVEVPARFEIGVSGLGWFPNPHSPRVFWAGIQAPPELERLANATQSLLESRLGIAAEKRRFAPHLTLARIEPGVSTLALKLAVAFLEYYWYVLLSEYAF